MGEAEKGATAPLGAPGTPGTPGSPARPPRTPAQRRVIFAYLAMTGLYILAASIIWGINTLFLLHAGLNIFQVFLVNTTFTVGQIIFEVPTGVLADTIGRKKALLAGVGTILVCTLIYVGAELFGWGIGAFIGASVFLGLGFTFQVGTMDAWLIDALAQVEWIGPREQVFAWGGVISGVGGFAGTIIGGLLGSINLSLPYIARAVLLGVCIVAIAVWVRDWGFQPKALEPSRIVAEARRVFVEGVRYGWSHPVIRPLLFVSFLQGLFFIYGFYSSQPYFLELLRRNLVWVAGLVSAGSFGAGIIGNLLVKRVMILPTGRRRATVVLGWLTALQGVLAIAIALLGLLVPAADRGLPVFAAAVAMWWVWGIGFGMVTPIRTTFLNEQIPSSERATVLSVDALFSDIGGSAGQPVLGYISQASSIGAAWVLGGLAVLAATPFYRQADRAAMRAAKQATSDVPEAAPGVRPAAQDAPPAAVADPPASGAEPHS